MRRFDGYVLDLDGTVYRGGRLIPGADQAVAAVRAAGSRVAFLSNNPTRSPDQWAEKLNALGIPAGPDDIVTSAQVLIEELRREAPGATLVVVAEPVLERTLLDAGFRFAAEPEE